MRMEAEHSGRARKERKTGGSHPRLIKKEKEKLRRHHLKKNRRSGAGYVIGEWETETNHPKKGQTAMQRGKDESWEEAGWEKVYHQIKVRKVRKNKKNYGRTERKEVQRSKTTHPFIKVQGRVIGASRKTPHKGSRDVPEEGKKNHIDQTVLPLLVSLRKKKHP